jgi:hypothetical protein
VSVGDLLEPSTDDEWLPPGDWFAISGVTGGCWTLNFGDEGGVERLIIDA